MNLEEYEERLCSTHLWNNIDEVHKFHNKLQELARRKLK